MTQVPLVDHTQRIPFTTEHSTTIDSNSLKEINEYKWQRCWNERRKLHRNRNYNNECDCECGSDEDDIFELEDLDRRLRQLKNFNRIPKSIDDNFEIDALEQRINILQEQIIMKNNKRASNFYEECMHEARVMLHRMRAPLCADDQEWKRMLDNLENDMEVDEEYIINQQDNRILNSIINEGPMKTLPTVYLNKNEKNHPHSSETTIVFNNATECHKYISSLHEPIQLIISNEYINDKELMKTFYNNFKISSIIQLDDNNEIEQKQSFKPLLLRNQQRLIIIILTSDSQDDEILNLSKQLILTTDCINIFDNAVDCFDYISTTKNSLISVIVLGDYANNQKILNMLNECPSVTMIYCQTDNQEFTNIYPKLQATFIELNPLCQRINTNLPVVPETFNVFSPNNIEQSIRDLNTENIAFIWYQIMIDLIRSFPNTDQTRNNFLMECRQQCIGDNYRLREIDDFERNYRSTAACEYYKKTACFFQIINEALRKQNVTKIYNLRMFINDISTQILEKNDTTIKKITVYRGQCIGNEEIDKLQGKEESFIAFNSFLSTTLNEEVANAFGGGGFSTNSETHSFLIIEIETTTNMCCDLSKYPGFPDEEEYLFMIGTIFKIISFKFESNKTYKMKLSCYEDQDCKQLDIIKKHFQQKISFDYGPINLIWGRFLYHIGEYNSAKEYYIKLLEELTNNQSDLIITITNDLAQIYFRQGLYIEANNYQEKALNQANQLFPTSNESILYENHGNILVKLNKYAKALDAYRHALIIENRRKPQRKEHLARIHSNMGMVHNYLHQFPLALRCFRHAFQIQRRISLANATDLAATCNNLGIVYTNIGEHKLAHKYYSEAFSIALRSLPYDHPTTQMYLRNRDIYLTATSIHENKKSYFIEIARLYRRDSNATIAEIEIILDSPIS
ncbi:unnamed protein product [Adineta ricciae]|uniref:NAD(P)(+)--arginine ADP-ribosyltransferase n=1 Tax=Adineta ricciae TaxID=249248 RepID=A0A815KN25_ADIRI|nr:unnamed protein product [Adineta ricciae]